MTTVSSDPDRDTIDGKIIENILKKSNEPNARISKSIRLGRGYSGANVYLVWTDKLPPIVIKTDEVKNIKKEMSGRNALYQKMRELRKNKLQTISKEMPLDGHMKIAGMAILWEGRTNYSEETISEMRDYILEYTPSSSSRISCTATFKKLLAAIRADDRNRTNQTQPQPLETQLPRIEQHRWQQINQILTIARTLSSKEGNTLRDIENWYYRYVSQCGTLSDISNQKIHGDLWFNNIFVDKYDNGANVIDFGNSSEGHIYQDIARFEVDLWLTSKTNEPLEAQLNLIYAAIRQFNLKNDYNDYADTPLGCWRRALGEIRDSITSETNFTCYRFFCSPTR